jgi:NAD(P)-dependent dehydrogenase (short-subunit alcohol dehydrogenase family)
MVGQIKNTMKTIVMTGGTAGIGLAALQQIRQSSDVRLLVGARGQASAGVKSLPLDLTRLASVRSFAAAVEEWLGEASIDGLVLNAGMQVSDVRQRTEDGFEITFAVNHLAHYLLLRLLMPRLASGAIVVITTSNLHNPKTNPFAPPEHADAEKLARGQIKLNKSPGSMSGLRAYSASKLCNLLTARALASSAIAQERRLRVIAFTPGLTPGTQLTRNQSLVFRLTNAVVMPILRGDPAHEHRCRWWRPSGGSGARQYRSPSEPPDERGIGSLAGAPNCAGRSGIRVRIGGWWPQLRSSPVTEPSRRVPCRSYHSRLGI